MKKLSRIIMFMVLTLIMLLPVACMITPEKSANGLVYELDLLTNTYTVVDYKAVESDVKVDGTTIYVDEVVIPATFNGKAVTKIDVNAFRQYYSETRHDYREYADFTAGKLKLETFKANKGDICYYAKVRKVVVPASVKVIGDYAFQNCSELKEVVLSDKVASIGNSAFAGCTALDTISLSDVEGEKTNQLPSAITKINDGAFFKCTALKEIYIPDSVSKIGKLAFASCTSLNSVKVERANAADFVMVGDAASVNMDDKDGVKISSIDNYAFKDSTKMEYFNVPNSVKTFGVAVFEMPKPDASNPNSTSALVGVSFSNQIKELGAGMFKNCVSLDEEQLDLSQIEKIGSGIFEGCTSLTAVQLNGKITAIPERAYYGCTGIQNVDLTQYYDNATDSYKPTQINYIGEAAFRGCSSLRSIELGDDKTSKITDIKRYAFKDCPALRSIYIPLTVIRIDPRVFENSGGTVIYAKDIVGGVGGAQVVRAPGWSNGSANIIKDFIEIVKATDVSGKVVAEYVILDKPGGENFGEANDPADDYASLARYVDFDNTTYTVPATVSYDSRDYKIEGILKASFKNCDALEAIEFDVNSNISSIESEAFANTTNVKNLDLSVTDIKVIPERAFAYGKSLQSVVLPTDIVEVKESAFEGCSSLKSMDLSAVTTLGKAIFKDCTALESVTLGSVKAFPEQIFYNASSLVDVKVADITAVTDVKTRAFYGCSSLNETNFPTSAMTALKNIESEAFYGCSGYKTIHISAVLTTIGGKAFAGCTGLASFTIDPNNKDFVVTAENVLFKKKSMNLTVKYFKSASDIAVGAADAVSFTTPITYYSELSYYPSNSESEELFVDMQNTYTYGKLLAMAKEHNGGNDVYAVTSTLRQFTSLNVGKDYLTSDGKIINVTTKSKKITAFDPNKGTYSGGEGFVVGKVDKASIIDYAFEGAKNLKKVQIYGNVLIGTGVFNNCTQLTEIVVLKSADDDGFGNVDGDGILYAYKKITAADGTESYKPYRLVQFPSGCEIERYEIPESVAQIDPAAFSNVKRIGTLVLNNNLGWLEADHGLDKALENANIGKIEINAQAAWVVEKNEEGVESHSLKLVADGVTSDKIYDNTNGKFILDQYGILYSVNLGSETVSVDGVTTTTRFLNYYQLLYVPTDIDLTGKTLTIPNGCTVMPYAFAGNDTLSTIVLGRRVSMVDYSFDGCTNLTILYQSGRVDFEDMGYLSEDNYKDNNGYDTNLAFRDAKVYYYSEDMIESDEFDFWHYKSALDPQTDAPYTYDSSIDSRVPAALNGSPVIHQDNDLIANYGYEYQLAVNDDGVYYQDAAGNWVVQTNNFGEDQFIYEIWD